MNQRVEPRFKTDTNVTLQFANKAEQIPARIVDVSGMGFRILAEQPIAVGETLQINAEDRRLLVTVRHCGPAENGYFVGVERIDKWLPGEAPEDASVLGRPQIKKEVDPLRVMALRNQFSKQSAGAGKDQRRGLMLGGIAAVIGLGVLALIWGGVRGSSHTTVPPPVVEKQAAKVAPETADHQERSGDSSSAARDRNQQAATSGPRQCARRGAGSTAASAAASGDKGTACAAGHSSSARPAAGHIACVRADLGGCLRRWKGGIFESF